MIFVKKKILFRKIIFKVNSDLPERHRPEYYYLLSFLFINFSQLLELHLFLPGKVYCNVDLKWHS